jgi:hypothetical protein
MVNVGARLKALERFFIAPRTVVLEIVAFLLLALLTLVFSIGRVIYSPWFIVVTAAGFVSLMIATIRMLRRDVRLTRAHGRLRVRGGTVLHVGLLGVLVFSSVALTTASEGIYVLVEGQSIPAGESPITRGSGPLASEFTLPQSLTLNRVSTSWWEDGSVQQIVSDLSIGDDARRFSVSVNGSRSVDGFRYYQDQRFGPTYLLTLENADGRTMKQRLDLPHPTPGSPTYLDVDLADGSTLRARCQSDIDPETTTLTLKKELGGVESEPVEFLGTGSHMLVGDTQVTVDDVRRWTALILVKQHGVGALFVSFFIVGIGAIMLYAAPVAKVGSSQPEGKAPQE